MRRHWSQHQHPTESQFKHGLRRRAVFIANRDAMQTFALNPLHLGIGIRGSILNQTGIGAAGHEMGPDIIRRAEQFVNVGLAIADMHESSRFTEQHRRRNQIIDPAHALFCFNRNACGFSRRFNSLVPLNDFLVQNITEDNPSGNPVGVTTSRVSASFTRSFAKNRYAAFVFAQS